MTHRCEHTDVHRCLSGDCEVWEGKTIEVLFFFRGAYGGFQARGPIGAVAAGLYHIRSNVGAELRLRPTQLTATLDP